MFPWFPPGGLQVFQRQHGDLCENALKSNQVVSPPIYHSPTTVTCDADIENHPATQVLPYLLLGNERDAADLQRLLSLHVSYILNVTAHVPLHHEKNGIKYKRLPATDNTEQNLRQYFEEAFSFIGKCIR